MYLAEQKEMHYKGYWSLSNDIHENPGKTKKERAAWSAGRDSYITEKLRIY